MDDDAAPIEDRLRSALTAGVAASEDEAGPVVADPARLTRRIAAHRRRQRALRVAAVVVVVALAAGGGWALGRDGSSGLDDVERVAGTTTTAVAPSTTAPEIAVSDAPVPVVDASSAAGPSTPYGAPSVGSTAAWSPGPVPPTARPSAPLFTRTLPDGTELDVRGNRYDPIAFDIPPFWDPPGWCLPAGDVYVGVRLPDAVGQVVGVRFDDVRPGEVRGDVAIVGQPEGQPEWVVVAQGPAGSHRIRATFPGGGSDEVELTDGLAVLIAPVPAGAPLDPDDAGIVPGPTITAEDAGGTVLGEGEIPWTASVGTAAIDDAEGPTAPPASWSSTALTPYGPAGPPDCVAPDALPPPGPEQPADPAAAEAEVRSTWDAAVVSPSGSPAPELFEDTTGLAEAQAEVRENQGDDLLATVTIPIDTVVFADADTAFIQYGVHVGQVDTTYFGRFAELVRVDGAWRVTRASVCRLLSLGGGTCAPPGDG